MKTILLTLLIGYFSISPTTKKKEEVPPGTIQLSEGYFVDETEITNFNWLEYLHWLKKHKGKTSAEYFEALPDTTIWEGVDDSLEKYYLRHPSYRDYPVVGITLKQAKSFCNWRSDRVNQYIYIRDNKLNISYADSLHIKCPKKFNYRIPTKDEWLDYSRIPYTERVLKKMEKKNDSFGHFYHHKPDSLIVNTTVPIFSYYPNEQGFYNIFGNVAEIVNEDNIAMGGSWRHSEAESKLLEGQKYMSPANWIGFRCVCDRVN